MVEELQNRRRSAMEDDDIKVMNKMICGCVFDLRVKVKERMSFVIHGVKDVVQHQPTTSAGVAAFDGFFSP